MQPKQRVQLEPAYLLHQRDFRDSSRILELLTRDHGRVCLFAHGSRRAGSPLAALLQPFVPLLISWSGSGDGGTLTGCEPAAPRALLAPSVLMSGFYLSELVLKLLGREDPHPDVYECYTLALAGLGESESRSLRLFEKRLLEALGFGIDYTRLAASGEPIAPDRYYHVRAERGVTGVASVAGASDVFSGRELLSLAAEDLGDDASLASAKRLLRAALEGPLDGREIRTRGVARALRSATQRMPDRPGDNDDNEGSAR